MAWCPSDSGLLLTCGKDNRTLCWDINTGEVRFPSMLENLLSLIKEIVHSSLAFVPAEKTVHDKSVCLSADKIITRVQEGF
jgi:WD40 repeat protein